MSIQAASGMAVPTRAVRALIRGVGGEALTHAAALLLDGQPAIELIEVDDPGALMDYCFGRGERLVMLEWPGRRTRGAIATHWSGTRRRWWVELGEPESLVWET